jgi:fructosamine-3-kinase
VSEFQRLGGGCVGDVFSARLSDGRRVVAKFDGSSTPRLDREAFMLRYLAENSQLPVPEVHFASPEVLVMALLPGRSQFDQASQTHAAALLAALHGIRAANYGLDQDTLIGGLHQPNPWTSSWLAFFRDQRLLFMGREAARSGRLPSELLRRVERFAGKLDRWLEEPEAPSLLHGDVWTTNVLAHEGRITGFLDPAVYYGHPEIELAFITLFGTFDDRFFRAYSAARPIKPGFFEERRDVYNLYPLLVHVRLFGGSYVHAVANTLDQFGF